MEQVSKQTPQIAKEMLIGEVMAKWPHTTATMARFGFKLGGCNVSPLETIEQTAKTQGLDDETIGNMVSAVNEELANELPPTSTDGIITLTETAAKHVKQIMESDGKGGYFLKLSAVPGGCSGFNYEMDFVEAPAPQDIKDESQGVKLVMEKGHQKFLKGITIDYRETLNSAGFVMQNPNATSGCSCGQSFS